MKNITFYSYDVQYAIARAPVMPRDLPLFNKTLGAVMTGFPVIFAGFTVPIMTTCIFFFEA